MRRIKKKFRTTMGEERLNSLALLHIHREISINLDEALTKCIIIIEKYINYRMFSRCMNNVSI